MRNKTGQPVELPCLRNELAGFGFPAAPGVADLVAEPGFAVLLPLLHLHLVDWAPAALAAIVAVRAGVVMCLEIAIRLGLVVVALVEYTRDAATL